jgi:hypothetical protein
MQWAREEDENAHGEREPYKSMRQMIPLVAAIILQLDGY